MFDKYGFYYTDHISENKYLLDVGASRLLELENNNYVVFHKRKFQKISTQKLQAKMSLVTQLVNINFELDEKFFVYWLVYYQRNLRQAHFKWWDLEQLETYQGLFENFGLHLKLRHYLEIYWDYPGLEEIYNEVKYANINQAISFLLALATIYGDWNLVEEPEDVYLSNVLIKFPFDASLTEFQDMIFALEDVLVQNKIYNFLTYSKKWDFIWNIKDFDLLKIMGEFLASEKVKDFFQIDESILPIFVKKLPTLAKQLDTDLRVNLDEFKLTEIEWIKLAI